MNKRLKTMLEMVETWPDERQEDAASVLLAMIEQGSGTYTLSDEERRAIDLSLAESSRGEFATDDEVAAVRRKHGL